MLSQALDLTIVFVYLISVLCIGVFARRYIKNITDFLVVGRGLNTSVAVATLVASEIGLVTMVYYAELGYVAGFAAMAVGVITGCTMWIIGTTGFVVRRLREMEIMTVPEFYERRFNVNVRVVGGIITATAGILNQVIFIVIGARFLNAVLGITDMYLSLTMIVLLIIILIYTILGGMLSVIITDYIQYIAMILGMGIVTWVSYSQTSFGEILHRLQTSLGRDGFDPISNPKFGIIFIIWQILLWFSANTIWQTSAMRIFSVKDVSLVKRTLQWGGIAFIGRATIPIFWGIMALVYFAGQNGEVEALDAMPLMLREIIPTGLMGLVLSAMLAAFMSTNSCYLLSWSAIITQDIIAPLRKKEMSSAQRIFLTRIWIVLIGIFMLVWGLWYQLPETAYQYLTLTGSMYLAGAFAAIVMGIYWKKTNAVGAYSAIVLSAVFPFLSVFLSQMKASLPAWLAFITGSNVAGILSYVVAFLGCIGGTIISQWRQSK